MRPSVALSCAWIALYAAGCGGPDEFPLPLPTEVTCNASNCDGCCIDNRCYAGNSAVACGTGGARCVQCQGINDCSAATHNCVQNLAAKWLLRAVSAEIEPKDPNDGLSWDADGSPPDVVVEITCAPSLGEAPVARRTEEVSSTQPTWTSGGCSSTVEALLASPVIIRVIDIDSFFDDEIVTASLQLKPEHFDSGTLVLQPMGGLRSLTLRLSRESAPMQ